MANQIEISVKTLTGKNIAINLADSNTVGELKIKICDREGNPSAQ